MNNWLSISKGDAPLIISIPHTGIIIPQHVSGFIAKEKAVLDADYYVDRLYDFAKTLGATIIKTDISRAVIDVNRNPDGTSLYPGQSVTELCPTTCFDGAAHYAAGQTPDENEIERRKITYYEPYHNALGEQIQRLRQIYQNIVLYDAHSIKSHVPRFFDGELPVFNIGSNDAKSCNIALTNTIAANCPIGEYVINGRFKGGYITRNYGRPENGVHAVQMELAMRLYLDETKPFPPNWDVEYAAPAHGILKNILVACIEFAKENK